MFVHLTQHEVCLKTKKHICSGLTFKNSLIIIIKQKVYVDFFKKLCYYVTPLDVTSIMRRGRYARRTYAW